MLLANIFILGEKRLIFSHGNAGMLSLLNKEFTMRP